MNHSVRPRMRWNSSQGVKSCGVQGWGGAKHARRLSRRKARQTRGCPLACLQASPLAWLGLASGALQERRRRGPAPRPPPCPPLPRLQGEGLLEEGRDDGRLVLPGVLLLAALVPESADACRPGLKELRAGVRWRLAHRGSGTPGVTCHDTARHFRRHVCPLAPPPGRAPQQYTACVPCLQWSHAAARLGIADVSKRKGRLLLAPPLPASRTEPACTTRGEAESADRSVWEQRSIPRGSRLRRQGRAGRSTCAAAAAVQQQQCSSSSSSSSSNAALQG